MPADTPAARGQMLSWLMFVASGHGALSQGRRFISASTRPSPSCPMPINRYDVRGAGATGASSRRNWLGKQQFMLWRRSSRIVDMAVWGWSRLIAVRAGTDGPKQFPNVQRHLAEINARPAAVRALALKDKHAFKAEMDEAAKLAMFPHLGKKVA
jgi:GST-like protein